ncbi:MAG: phosphodiesterase [Rhodanobacter sp. SCN 68-63]|nr:MAG: phosphodiesterase [Rhodanobacter sp. SCN 68-63]
MVIISHRGFWRSADEKNTREAFQRSFDSGFGTETDVRDACGALVISHDMPDGSEMTLTEFLGILGGRDLPIAFNIKADGISKKLVRHLVDQGIKSWFTFDMSVPELVAQLQNGAPAYTRASEYENPPSCYQAAAGVWLDSFESEWYDMTFINKLLNDGKKVCIVSPELHKRDHIPLWAALKASGIWSDPSLMLCTDFPSEAKTFFQERQ